MATKSFAKLDGTVEVDETYVGGQAKFMHKWIRDEKIRGTGGVDNVAIQGAVQRGGPVVATVYTDQASAYVGLDRNFAHKSINHSCEYVSGDVYTNTLENFWTLYKRSVAPTPTTCVVTRTATSPSARSPTTTATLATLAGCALQRRERTVGGSPGTS